MYYGTAPMAKWLHAKLAAMLGVTPEALSARGQLERAAQSQRLLPGGLPTACRNTPPLPDDQPRLLEDLKVIYRHRPQYGPKMADAAREAAGKDTVFTFAGEVTEHGTLAYSRPASVHSGGQRPVNTSTLQEALQVAQQAAYLSRWEPVVIDTCPVSVPVRITVRF